MFCFIKFFHKEDIDQNDDSAEEIGKFITKSCGQ